MKIYVSHAKAFDFVNKLYTPLRSSRLNNEHDFFLPYESERQENTKDLIKSCDLVIAEVSVPSLGEGIELGWANMLGVPIVCISPQGSKVSKSLQYITKEFIVYENPTDMIEKIELYLK